MLEFIQNKLDFIRSAFKRSRENVDNSSYKRAEKYLDIANDVRKFEIGLVWQRSLFFWGFIGAAFVAYGDMSGGGHADPDARIVVACFGFVCSVAWTLLNRGSKYWQESWETKTERKERVVLGELLFARREAIQKKFLLLRAQKYSVSKLLIALSDFTALVWLFLLMKLLPWSELNSSFLNWFSINLHFPRPFLALIVAVVYAGYMLVACRTSPPKS